MMSKQAATVVVCCCGGGAWLAAWPVGFIARRL
jgi:hypothetical protein